MFLCNNFVCSSDQVMISHMNRWLGCRIMWYIVAWSHHQYLFKSQKYIAQNLKYTLIAHGMDARLSMGAWGLTSWMLLPPISGRQFWHCNTPRVRADWKEINPPTKTFCSFHKNLERLNFVAMHQWTVLVLLWNGTCHLSSIAGASLSYSSGTLSCNQVTVTYLKIGHW